MFTTLPHEVGFGSEPVWWPLPWPPLAGLLVALTIRYLPGSAGHKPAEGFKTGGPVLPIELPGIVLASLATLCLGVVLGPEAPLIAIGSGLGVLAVHLAKKDAPAQAIAVIAAAGSFAAISTLLGSPLVGAFLLMEIAGLGGPMLGVVLVPGLLAAGVGSLIFVGLDAWTGFGTFSLAIPDIPPFGSPTGAEFLWAVAIGVARRRARHRHPAAGPVPAAGRRAANDPADPGRRPGGRRACDRVRRRQPTGARRRCSSPARTQLPSLIESAAGWSVGALVLLVACKGLAYGLSLSCFRGGPVFPALFIGAAGGIALSHAPGLPMIAGAGMGIGAMSVTMLGLPLTSVLLVSVFLQADALALMPLVIVAVVVAYVTSARLAPPKTANPAPAPGPAS